MVEVVHLTCLREYLSIKSCPPFALQPLSVLVGLNGSGKSQLLQAIANGAIAVKDDQGPIAKDEIALIGAKEMVEYIGGRQAQPARAYMHQAIKSEEAFQAARRRLLTEALRILEAGFLEAEKPFPEGWDDWAAGPAAIMKQYDVFAGHVSIGDAFRMAERVPLRAPHYVSGTTSDEETAEIVNGASEASGLPAWQISFRDYQAWRFGRDEEALHLDIADAIYSYARREEENDVQRVRQPKYGGAPALSEVEFLKAHGPHPVDAVSALMKEFGLDYEMLKPDIRAHRPETGDRPPVFLRHVRSGTVVGIGGLSSGERTMLRFILALFEGYALRHRIRYPRLLLIDEVDGALHPAMVQNWMAAIQREFVEKRGMSCFIATHSPTTVALAPETSIYEKQRLRTDPVKIEQRWAIRRLTHGIPTLSIHVSDNRLVFTEDHSDAELFTALQAAMGGDLDLPRSLLFSGCGLTGKKKTSHADGTVEEGQGGVGNGCGMVRHIVNTFNAQDRTPVYGVVDYDKGERPQGKVHVLAHGSHYAIENVLLDPLLLAFLMIDQSKGALQSHVITEAFHYSQPELQKLADIVAYDELGFERVGEGRPSKYFGGMSIVVPRAMQTMNGHELDRLVQEKWPWTKAKHLSGQPAMAVTQRVIRSQRVFCPKPIVDLFRAIATDGDEDGQHSVAAT